MNTTTYSGKLFRLSHRLMLGMRRVGASTVSKSFSSTDNRRLDAIQQIYVINLNRQVARWNNIQRELQKLYDNSGYPLNKLAKRVPAFDARDIVKSPSPLVLQTCYSLADQLFVEPSPILGPDDVSGSQCIAMTCQEVAVALSHIAVWRLVASSDRPYALVLEDDVYFCRNFAHILDSAWEELTRTYNPSAAFDILYLSYEEAKTQAKKQRVSDILFKPLRGLWWLSGYVLSQKGAQNLLRLLPVRGPVDLWINHQFENLDVFATQRTIIDQRRDCRSDNLYSILPVLARVGVLTQEKPLLFKTRKLPKPVFAFGRHGTGLTSLAMALSMLGYRCCNDMKELPKCEHSALFGNKKSRVFDAYVNVGSLWNSRCIDLAKLYRKAKFIITVSNEEELSRLSQEILNGELSGMSSVYDRLDSFRTTYTLLWQLRQLSAEILRLPVQTLNKWLVLCEFLDCEHPIFQYPSFEDEVQRDLSIKNVGESERTSTKLKKMRFDSSPWIAPSRRKWHGIPLSEVNSNSLWEHSTTTVDDRFRTFDSSVWMLRDDTFPDNLARFSPMNFSSTSDNFTRLTLRKEPAHVREYTSASLCSRRRYLYGRFSVMVRPANVAGLVTGVFLHRNSPRQEIDIEFLGKDTTKLLVNVFYNPGDEGTNLEYGYRGTPVLIDLGFDASKDFHQYSIEWCPTSIGWLIDGRLVYKRSNWDPTPIPHLPMQFHVNLWCSRSRELAGRLFDRDLPAHSEIASVDIQYIQASSSVCEN